MQLGVWMPFGKAAQQLRRFRQTDVSRPTAKRVTEAAGAAYVAWQTAEVAPSSGSCRATGGAGAVVHECRWGAYSLSRRDWAEVKTLVLGVVQPPKVVKGETGIGTTEHPTFPA